MMSQKIEKVKNALISITDLKVYHYWRPRLQAPFCVYAEDEEGDSLHTNNKKSEQVVSGTIDYFTKVEFDTMIDQIQDALNETEDVAWRLNSVQYEEETNLIHYEWDFEVI